jgi:hypothetical protein
MKLTEALKKSNVQIIKRASQDRVYQAVGNDLYELPYTDDASAVKLGLDDINANDWCAQHMTWIGSREPKKKAEAK